MMVILGAKQRPPTLKTILVWDFKTPGASGTYVALTIFVNISSTPVCTTK
jgi:hypothetical protein